MPNRLSTDAGRVLFLYEHDARVNFPAEVFAALRILPSAAILTRDEFQSVLNDTARGHGAVHAKLAKVTKGYDDNGPDAA